MKNNTKEVKELKKQVLEDFATAQIKVLNDLTKLVEFNNAENK